MTKAYRRSGRAGGGRRGGRDRAGGVRRLPARRTSPAWATAAATTARSPTTTLPKGNPTQLLDEWATCMRSHGDPDQVDPTIDANKVIHITFPADANGTGPDVRREGLERSVRRLPDRGLHGAAGRQAAPEARPGQAGEVLPVHAGPRHPRLPGPERWRPVDPDASGQRPEPAQPDLPERLQAVRQEDRRARLWQRHARRPGPSRPPAVGGPRGRPGRQRRGGCQRRDQLGGSPVAEFAARRVAVVGGRGRRAGRRGGGGRGGGGRQRQPRPARARRRAATRVGWPPRRWCGPTWRRRSRSAGRSATTGRTR